VASSSSCDNKYKGPIKGRKFIEYLSDCQLLEKDCYMEVVLTIFLFYQVKIRQCMCYLKFSQKWL
jgi:hypothetical protein